MNVRRFETVAKRRKALEQALHVRLDAIGRSTLDQSIASSRNCENMIGATEVPMGVAGPLKVRRQSSDVSRQTRICYVPLATTEGALVASVSRGCKAVTESGGALVDSYQIGPTRGPVFQVKDLEESDRLNTFLEHRFRALQRIAEKTSHHLTLKRFMSRGVGRYRFIRFIFDTEDAMGMNMATIATDAIVGYIEQEAGVRCLSVAGNYDVDKKPSWLNSIEGRGIKVWAEVTLTSTVLKEILKASAKQIYDVWLGKCMIGSAMSGAMGFNAQFANVVAALFLATGQDPGHIGEGSMGVTTTEVISEDLYVSVYLPDLMVGTVGGGTGLPTQKEALELLGVAGGNAGKNAQILAEIVGATVLAGEISLLASLAQGTLSKAHQLLARGK